jgi:hypothetical protein
MNMVGLAPLNCGFTMHALPTELKALTKRAPLNSRCRRSINESSRLVKNFNTPLAGGASAMGLVVSTTGLPARFGAVAARSASIAAVPLTASTISSPKRATSAKDPNGILGLSFAQSLSFAGVLVPTITSWPCARHPLASTFPTSPEPRTPIFILPS